MGKLLDEMKRAYENGEFDDYFEKLARKQDREEYWVNKSNAYFDTLSDEEFDRLMLKFFEWESNYQEMWYKRGVMTASNLMGNLWEVSKSFGTDIPNDEDFPTERNEYRGFVFSLTHGQGSFFWVSHNGERIL